MCTGTWEQKGDSLVLNTAKKPETDFLSATSKQVSNKKITVKVKDPNTMILGYVYCRILTTDGKLLEATSDQDGVITFDYVPIQSISLLHELWPDRFSDFKVNQPSHNYFEFTIGRWIVDVEIKNLALHIKGKGLMGQHPLMEGNEFTYAGE